MINWYPPLLAFCSSILVFIVGMAILTLAKQQLTKRILCYQDPTVHVFLVNCFYVVMVTIVVIMALTLMGVPTTALITVLGAASLAVGLALKEFLSNVAAGFALIFLRPFKVGDTITVMNTISGTVVEINLFVTQIDTVTNEAIFVPNSQLINAAIVNKTYHPLRQLDLRFLLALDVDVALAKQVLLDGVKSHAAIELNPPPYCAVFSTTDNGVTLLLRAWVNGTVYTVTEHELNELLRSLLREKGIHAPTQQMEVILRQS